MSIDKFTVLISGGVPLPAENIDTDQIIPARFLKATERKGFGENLFRDWRYDHNGKKIPGFALNDDRYRGKILFAGDNFGCGSSREHAAWALYDYGFRAVVSTSFADIFRNNALNCGVLPVQVERQFLEDALATINADPANLFSIDLREQIITNLSGGQTVGFDIDAHKRECLIQGYDDVDYLVSLSGQIEEYERKAVK